MSGWRATGEARMPAKGLSDIASAETDWQHSGYIETARRAGVASQFQLDTSIGPVRNVLLHQVIEAINERRLAVKTLAPHPGYTDNEWNAAWRPLLWTDIGSGTPVQVLDRIRWFITRKTKPTGRIDFEGSCLGRMFAGVNSTYTVIKSLDTADALVQYGRLVDAQANGVTIGGMYGSLFGFYVDDDLYAATLADGVAAATRTVLLKARHINELMIAVNLCRNMFPGEGIGTSVVAYKCYGVIEKWGRSRDAEDGFKEAWSRARTEAFVSGTPRADDTIQNLNIVMRGIDADTRFAVMCEAAIAKGSYWNSQNEGDLTHIEAGETEHNYLGVLYPGVWVPSPSFWVHPEVKPEAGNDWYFLVIGDNENPEPAPNGWPTSHVVEIEVLSATARPTADEMWNAMTAGNDNNDVAGFYYTPYRWRLLLARCIPEFEYSGDYNFT